MSCIMTMAITRSRGSITRRWSSIALVWWSSISSSIDWELKYNNSVSSLRMITKFLLILDMCGTF